MTVSTIAYDLPTGREEQWRFTPLGPLRPLLEGVVADGEPEVSWHVDGQVTVERVGMDDPRVGSGFTPRDRIAAVAFERAEQALVVTVARDAQDVLVHVTTKGQGGVSYSHLVVDVASGASATVVLDHVGTLTTADNVEYLVGDNAALTAVSVQDWDVDAVHAASHAARLGRDARFKSIVVTLGGALVRLVPTVAYTAPGGDAELLGLYFADAGQHLEHRSFVDHSQPRCRSRVEYRGALQGRGAHTVWIGDVLIRKAAEGIDTYELNRNLVLTDGARADSVPNLEIETGEIVGAGHASATGRFDDEQLFYLQARGIPAQDARRLVVRGFFAGIINRIELPEIRDRLLAAIETELQAVGA